MFKRLSRTIYIVVNLHVYILIIAAITFFAAPNNIVQAQTFIQIQSQVKENTQQISRMEAAIGDLKDNYRLLYDGAKNQNDQLGNQISWSNYLLSLLSLIVTVGGLFLAWYINRQYEKIKQMKEIVDKTKKAIDGHTSDLYKKLKREETVSLLQRLMIVPEDISNVCHLLLSRDLRSDDFVYLKGLYLKTKNSPLPNSRGLSDYMTLLIQHFPYESLIDEDLKGEVAKNITLSILNHMFIKDIKNFFDNVLRYLKEFRIDSEINKDIIGNLFYQYSKSVFKQDVDLKTYIKELLIKNGLKTAITVTILKQKASSDLEYIAFLDSIFV